MYEFDTYELIVPQVDKVEYETENFQYTVTYKYLPDFKVKTKSGKIFYVETKGAGRSFDSNNQRKLIAMLQQHPEIDLRILFYRDAPLRKGSPFRQSNWAEKHGFKYAIGQIPEEWYNE